MFTALLAATAAAAEARQAIEEATSFADVFTVSGMATLGMLILLQAVLGFDNLLYISLESKRAPVESQKWVRTSGILIAVALRIVLLFVLMQAIDSFKEAVFTLPEDSPIGWLLSGTFNLHAIIVLVGGVFILYTALKEIMHMLSVEELGHDSNATKSTAAGIVAKIVLMNLVFSFDSILSAMALTKNFWIMAIAIIISGVLMIVLADGVSEFLKKNRLYEVLGLFVLLIVGVMLMGEGGHLAHLRLADYPVEPLSKTTFYFTIITLVLIDVVQGRYQRKLMAEKQREALASASQPPTSA